MLFGEYQSSRGHVPPTIARQHHPSHIIRQACLTPAHRTTRETTSQSKGARSCDERGFSQGRRSPWLALFVVSPIIRAHRVKRTILSAKYSVPGCTCGREDVPASDILEGTSPLRAVSPCRSTAEDRPSTTTTLELLLYWECT